MTQLQLCIVHHWFLPALSQKLTWKALLPQTLIHRSKWETPTLKYVCYVITGVVLCFNLIGCSVAR